MLYVRRDGTVLDLPLPDLLGAAAAQASPAGSRVRELLPPALAEAVMDALSQASGGARRGFVTLRWTEREPARELEIWACATARTDEAAPECFIVTCTDTTERRQAEQALRTSEQRYRLLAEHASDVIWTMGIDGRITSLSAAVEKVRGFTVEEAMHQTLDQILAPQSQTEVIRYFEALHGAIAQGQPPPTYRGEQQYLCKDGSTFWADVIACPVIDAEGRVVELLGVSRDISRKVAQQQHLERLVQARTGELSLAKEAAESASRAKSEFLANVGHELRTPLHAILGFTDLALGAATDAAQREDLQHVLEASRRLGKLIDAILETARLQAERVTLDCVELTPGAVMDAVVQLMAPMARDKGLRLGLSVEPDAAALRLMGDELRLRLVLANLVSNAIKFTPAGEVTLRCALGPSADGRCHLRFEVSDTGIGIAPQDQARIFHAFEQVDAAANRHYEGAGLGLPISRRLAEAMGGSLNVTSRPGQGSTFTLLVSLEQASETQAQTQTPTQPQAQAAGSPASDAAARSPTVTPDPSETDTPLPPGQAAPVLDWLAELIVHLETGDPAVRQWMDQAPDALSRALPQPMQRLRSRLALYDFDAALEMAQALKARLEARDMQG